MMMNNMFKNNLTNNPNNIVNSTNVDSNKQQLSNDASQFSTQISSKPGQQPIILNFYSSKGNNPNQSNQASQPSQNTNMNQNAFPNIINPYAQNYLTANNNLTTNTNANANTNTSINNTAPANTNNAMPNLQQQMRFPHSQMAGTNINTPNNNLTMPQAQNTNPMARNNMQTPNNLMQQRMLMMMQAQMLNKMNNQNSANTALSQMNSTNNNSSNQSKGNMNELIQSMISKLSNPVENITDNLTNEENSIRDDKNEFERDYSLEDENLKQLWSGFITKNKKDRVCVDAYQIRNDCGQFFNNEFNLNVSHRTQFDEIMKRTIIGIVAFSPQNETQCQIFDTYIEYFFGKQRVGVVNLRYPAILYIIPPCEFSRKFYQNPRKHLLGIYVDSNAEPKSYVDMNNLVLPPPVISLTEKKQLLKQQKNKASSLNVPSANSSKNNSSLNVNPNTSVNVDSDKDNLGDLMAKLKDVDPGKYILLSLDLLLKTLQDANMADNANIELIKSYFNK